MLPWIWIFAPQTYWPLSGSVAQDLSPEAFFRGIKPGAGVPEIEQKVFEQVSYGKQLGWLTDVVVEAVDTKTLRSAEAQSSLDSLKRLQAKIERIKEDHRQDQTETAIALLDRIAADSPDELRRVLLRYQNGHDLRGAPPRRPRR